MEFEITRVDCISVVLPMSLLTEFYNLLSFASEYSFYGTMRLYDTQWGNSLYALSLRSEDDALEYSNRGLLLVYEFKIKLINLNIFSKHDLSIY